MSESDRSAPRERPVRKRRSDGQRSRDAILREAAQLATVEGLGGLSIGRLAEAVGMSKSGLFAHFGSKEELQLATIERASDVFTELVLEPARSAETGLERLRLLADGYLRHVEGRVYPGGCFFASLTAEVDTRPGPVREVAVQFLRGWLQLLETAVRDAQAEGEIDPAEDAAQLAYEVEAFLVLANMVFVATGEQAPIERARHALERRLAAAAPAALAD